VDPRLDVPRDPVLLGEGTKDGCAVVAPLAGGPALLATAAPNSSALRDLLDEAQKRALGHSQRAADGTGLRTAGLSGW
jgi:urease accessory protein